MLVYCSFLNALQFSHLQIFKPSQPFHCQNLNAVTIFVLRYPSSSRLNFRSHHNIHPVSVPSLSQALSCPNPLNRNEHPASFNSPITIVALPRFPPLSWPSSHFISCVGLIPKIYDHRRRRQDERDRKACPQNPGFLVRRPLHAT